MKGKPKSHRAVLLAAAHCKHPANDAVDTALLLYLAVNSDRGTGENSHPGNRNIADALKLTDSPTDARLGKLITRGLIERTARADGRGKASSYRLCLESEHYPDQTPGGEGLVETAPPIQGGIETAPATQGGIETALRPTETALCDTGNRPVQEPKPPCAADKPPCAVAETALPRQAATRDSQESTNYPPANHGEAAGWQAGGQRVGRVSPHPKTQTERDRWLAFINAAELPDALRYAEPMPETRTKVLVQLDEIGNTEFMGMALGEWEQLQSPPLSTLAYGRWERWIETGSAVFAEWKEDTRK
jgi:hypothetical protein